MTAEQEEKVLNDLFDAYMNKVADRAETIRQRYVIPYCDKWSLHFLSGNGTYGFWMTDKTPERFKSRLPSRPVMGLLGKMIWMDDLPKHILRYLDVDIPGTRVSLGCYMECYEPEYK